MSFEIKLNYAVLSRDTQVLCNMDPYCILAIGRERYRSRTARGSGKKPIWFQTFRFDSLLNQLKVTMMDKDTFVDDLIGEGSLNLLKFRYLHGEHKEFVQLRFKEQPAGIVQLVIQSLRVDCQVPLMPNPFNCSNPFMQPSYCQHPNNKIESNFQHRPNIRMQNHGMQILQGINMNGYEKFNQESKRQPFKNINDQGKFRDNYPFDNGWGNFDPTYAIYQNASHRLANQPVKKEKNPFRMLQQALAARQIQNMRRNQILEQLQQKQKVISNNLSNGRGKYR